MMAFTRFNRTTRQKFWEVSDRGRYHWSDYWGCWRKVLRVEITPEFNLKVSELILTGEEAGKVLCHGTELGKNDLLVDAPPEVVRVLEAKAKRKLGI